MTFDDHWADTQTRLRLWAAQLGFKDEGDPDGGFRFVLDSSTTGSLATMCGEIIVDLDLKQSDGLIKRNLLVYFIARLDGQIVIQMPRNSLYFCHLQPGSCLINRDSGHGDKQRLWDKYANDLEELIQDLFERKLNDCRRAQIKAVPNG